MRIIEIGTKLYKKAYKTGSDSTDTTHVVVELEVTEPGILADYESDYGEYNRFQKCRVRAARVVAIKDRDDNDCEYAYSVHDLEFVYGVGDEVRPTKPFNEYNVACGAGIHGFEDVDDAWDYDFN